MDEYGVRFAFGYIIYRRFHVCESFDWSDGYSMVHRYDDSLAILFEYPSESPGFSSFHFFLDHLMSFFARKSSALRMEHPAPPRTRLWPRAMYFIPFNAGSRRTRPTVTVIPFPSSTSSRVCGRSSSSRTTIGCSGAEGSLSCWGAPLNPRITFTISLGVAGDRVLAKTASMCPWSVVTLLQLADNVITAGFDSVASIFMDTCSTF